MKIGDEVNFYAGAVRHAATVTAVGAPGKSLNKQLDLEYRESGQIVRVANIPHLKDAAEGEPFWQVKGQRVDTERREATAEVKEVIEETAEATVSTRERRRG